MIGINSQTGKALSGIAHLRQSVLDILTTPLGSRVMRREYGSRLFELIDAPLNATTIADLYAATAEALMIWEPRIAVERVQSIVDGPNVSLIVSGRYLPDGRPVVIDSIPVR